jgi:hypothetical protein
MRVLPFRETAKVPLFGPLAAGSELQRDRRHLRAPHEDVQYTEHAGQNSTGKSTKPRRDARAAGRAVQEGWGNVRASTAKRETAMHDLRLCPGNDTAPTQGSARRISRTETCKEEPPSPE